MNKPKALPHTLVAIQDGKYVGTRYFIILDDDSKPFSVCISDETYLKLGEPKVKTVLSDGIYASLLDLSKKRKALQNGYSILKFGDNSVFSMKNKLRRHGYSSDQVEYVIQQLSSEHLLDDKRTAENFVFRCQKKKWGPKRTYQYLLQHGIRSEDAKQVISQFKEQFDAIKQQLCQELLDEGKSDTEIKKELYKLGY